MNWIARQILIVILVHCYVRAVLIWGWIMASVYGRPELRIGVWKEAFAFPFRNFFTLLQFSLMPTLIALALSLAILRYFLPSNMPTTPEELQPYVEAVNSALNAINFVIVVFGLVVAVCIHRLIVSRERPGWIIVRFGRYEIAYAGAILVFTLVILALLVPLAAGIAASVFFGLVPAEVFTTSGPLDTAVAERLGIFGVLFALGIMVTVIVILWVEVRLALIFPHAAVTGQISLGVSWEAMKGNFGRFLAAILILGLISLVLLGVVGGAIFALATSYFVSFPAPATNDPAQMANMLYGVLLIQLCMMPLYVFGFSMFVALISYIYADLVGDTWNAGAGAVR